MPMKPRAKSELAMCSNHTSHHPPPAVLETLSIGRGPLALQSKSANSSSAACVNRSTHLKSNRNSAAIQSFKSGHRSLSYQCQQHKQMESNSPPTLYFCATTSHRVRTQSSALVSASARRGGAPPLAHLAGFVISA